MSRLSVTTAQARQLLGKPAAKHARKRSPVGHEKHVLKAVLNYLKAEGIWAMRVNSGIQVVAALACNRRVIRAAPKGTADVLAIVPAGRKFHDHRENPALVYVLDAVPLWIECKSPVGHQTIAQREFQERMERDGALYCLARSVEDVQAILPPKQAKGAAA